MQYTSKTAHIRKPSSSRLPCLEQGTRARANEREACAFCFSGSLSHQTAYRVWDSSSLLYFSPATPGLPRFCTASGLHAARTALQRRQTVIWDMASSDLRMILVILPASWFVFQIFQLPTLKCDPTSKDYPRSAGGRLGDQHLLIPGAKLSNCLMDNVHKSGPSIPESTGLVYTITRSPFKARIVLKEGVTACFEPRRP